MGSGSMVREPFIKRVRVRNFKSFKDAEVNLGKFTVIIGANASGKSNFMNIFRFLRDASRHGLDTAISMQGGVSYLRNLNSTVSDSRELSVEVTFGPFRVTKRGNPSVDILCKETVYRLSVQFARSGINFIDVKEELKQNNEYIERHKDGGEESKGCGEISLVRENRELKVRSIDIPESVPIKSELEGMLHAFARERMSEFQDSWKGRSSRDDCFLLRSMFFYPLFFPVSAIIDDLSVYRLDPNLAKSSAPITGSRELKEDGSNLSVVLRNIVNQGGKQKERFLGLLRNFLPFVAELRIEDLADGTQLFELRESYSGGKYLPSVLLSDGTVLLTALVVILYFSKKRVVMIEEPERAVHPYLIAKLIEMLKDPGLVKQVVVTTHSPEVLKWAGIDNILFMSRDRDGFSRVSKPVDSETIRDFLEEVGIDELYVQNLLEG
ncbi:AAA family ATPase [Ammonifex thiophilus]|uniref:ATPase n=1 Tax=Ammonifex thiophilus TaxID=444093 RepID=A0A3D8P112_9THEO|nr:AAA family ATPase [Ammonifex thiophilus]RDV80899.1 ATPase [Ammonifex thiophilus]